MMALQFVGSAANPLNIVVYVNLIVWILQIGRNPAANCFEPPTAGFHDATPNTVTIPPFTEKRGPRFSSGFGGFGGA